MGQSVRASRARLQPTRRASRAELGMIIRGYTVRWTNCSCTWPAPEKLRRVFTLLVGTAPRSLFLFQFRKLFKLCQFISAGFGVMHLPVNLGQQIVGLCGGRVSVNCREKLSPGFFRLDRKSVV